MTSQAIDHCHKRVEEGHHSDTTVRPSRQAIAAEAARWLAGCGLGPVRDLVLSGLESHGMAWSQLRTLRSGENRVPVTGLDRQCGQ